jgi:hypothetical protein|tara:strand:- start:128 stop:406 length:279 start_codon:yes stop_codon:yes gene_type:complete
MKVIRYTLLSNGKIPTNVNDGGYFIKSNGGKSPQNNDLIGLSLDWVGLEEYTTKSSFEVYIKSFCDDYIDEFTKETVLIQDVINNFWNKSII